jgi:hypothetical protein
MAWIGSISDEEVARKAAGSILMGQTLFAVEAANMTSIATARAEATLNAASMSVCDNFLLTPVLRGYQIASNLGATFTTNYTTVYASLPSSAGHVRNMLQG